MLFRSAARVHDHLDLEGARPVEAEGALEAEHREGSAQIQTIEACLSAARSDPARYGDLADAIDRFADAQWQHLSTEEKLILPAARQHLDETDWQGIASAFQQNAGVRVGSEQDEAFKRMFVRLMNRASA